MKISEYVTHDQLDRQRKAALGQFLTPEPVADLMASLFDARWKELELLDAGAGSGSLTTALVRRLCAERERPKRITVAAYELDPALLEPLRATLSQCRRDCELAGIEFLSVVLNVTISCRLPQGERSPSPASGRGRG